MDARTISDNPIRLGIPHRTLMVGPRAASIHLVRVASILRITVLSRVPIIQVLLFVHLLTLELMAILLVHLTSLWDASIAEIPLTSCETVQCSLLNSKDNHVNKIQVSLIRHHNLVHVRRIQTGESISPAHEKVIQGMVDGLPSELTSKQRERVRELLVQYCTILSLGDHDVGRTHLVQHTIDTGDHRPVRQPLRWQPFQHQDYIDQETNRMLEYGIIEPAASPWASNVVLVTKKDGSLRFCVDYRRLNSITYKDSYPLPLIDNCLNSLAGSSFTARWTSARDITISP